MNMMIGSHYSGLGTIYPGYTALNQKSLVCSTNFAELEMRVMSHLMQMVNTCPRVRIRMECPECGYPLTEARYSLDRRISHRDNNNKKNNERTEDTSSSNQGPDKL